MGTNKVKTNYDICLFFDIETSTITTDNGEEVQETYLTNILTVDLINFEIVDSKFFRTIHDSLNYMNKISADEGLICYCHNLDYELFHILRDTKAYGTLRDKTDIYDLPIPNSIFRDKNAPLSIFLDVIPNINLRCSYALFNKGVKDLGEDVGLNKLEYDYKVTRTPYDDLTQLDYDYNERDNVIVALSLMQRMKDRKETLKEVPLTFTASTKKDRFNFIKDNFGKGALRSLNIESANVYNDYDFYKMCIDAYAGGLTTALYTMFNVPVLNKMFSIDITSSYPYQLASRKFPVYLNDTTYHFKDEDADNYYSEFLHGYSFQDLAKYTSIKGYIATITIENISLKDSRYFIPLSASKCLYLENEVVINGKVKSADKIILSVDNVTLSWINLVYKYNDIICSEIVMTTKDRYLKLAELSFIFHNFLIKQTMKNVEGQELNYALAKVNNNNMYGVKVQKPLKSRYDIVEGEIIKIDSDSLTAPLSPMEIYDNFIDLKEQNKFKTLEGKNFDIFTDGVYCTSYARYMLIETHIKLIENGCKCIYTDTDSLKFSCEDPIKLRKFLKDLNNEIIEGNKKNYRFTEFKEKFKISEDQFNVLCGLGNWDIENEVVNDNIIPYDYFKTLGAKKYCYVDHKGIHTTIAGCSKKVGQTIELYCTKNKISFSEGIEEIFNVGTKFDESCSGRTVSYREDRTTEYLSTLKYKNKSILGCGGMIIKDTTYTLNLSVSDEDHLEMKRIKDVVRIINEEGKVKYE